MQGVPMQGVPMQGMPMQGMPAAVMGSPGGCAQAPTMMPPGGYEIPLDSAVDCYGDPCADPGMCGPGRRPCAGWLHRLCARLGNCCSNLSCRSCLGWQHGPTETAAAVCRDGTTSTPNGCIGRGTSTNRCNWLPRGFSDPDALNLNDLDFDEQSGFRVTWAYPIAPAAALEVTYFGQLNWAASAVASGDMNLFSVFSDFGSDPLYGYPRDRLRLSAERVAVDRDRQWGVELAAPLGFRQLHVA